MKGSSGEVEDIKIRKCIRKSHVDIINEEMKGNSSKYEQIGILKCRRRSRVDIINEELKGWKSSTKQEESPTEPTNTKDDISLKQMKIKVKRAALEWDDFVLQEQLKSLMYVDRSPSGYPNMDELIYDLNFKNCMRLKRKKASKFFVGIT